MNTHSSYPTLMKLKSIKTLAGLFATSALIASSSHAQTVIIDGTGPTYTLNGSFESGTDGAPVDWLADDGSGTALADELGFNRGLGYRTNTPLDDGAQYIVVGTAANNATYGAYLNTGYTLSTGDTFDLSFWTKNHANNTTNDSLNFQLFTTTNNTDSGTIDDVIYSNTVTGSGSTTWVNTSLSDIGSTLADANGKTLFIAFTHSSSDQGFFGLDQVNLTVIPEPSMTGGLLGLSALLLVSMRRRKK